MSRLAHAAQNVQTEYQPQTVKEREREMCCASRQTEVLKYHWRTGETDTKGKIKKRREGDGDGCGMRDVGEGMERGRR